MRGGKNQRGQGSVQSRLLLPVVISGTASAVQAWSNNLANKKHIVADAAVTAIVVSGALGRDVSWEDVARVWFYDLIWFVLTDLCKIPLTMTIENCFPPIPVTEAPVPDESDHVLAFGCVDLGYAYVRDTKENVRRRSSRRSSVDVEAPSGAAAEGVV